MRCVGVALANRINSEVLRSIINYKINKEVNRDEESLEEKIDATRAIRRRERFQGSISQIFDWKIVVHIELPFCQVLPFFGIGHAESI